jgi:YjjG family noncanonical pyrimidine nucleotidase
MSYNCLLLDLDETLVSFKESEKQAILRLYAKYGIPDTDENREYYHELNKDLWTDLKDGKLRKPELEKARFNTLIEKFDIKNVKADQLNREFEGYLKQSVVPFDGALEFLEDIEDYATLAIVTNGYETVQQNRLKISRIADFVDEVVTSEKAGASKPDKRIFQSAIKKLGISNTRTVLVVGDSLNTDIKGGINAGLDTCWVNFAGDENRTGIKPTYTVTSYMELKNIVMEGKNVIEKDRV